MPIYDFNNYLFFLKKEGGVNIQIYYLRRHYLGQDIDWDSLRKSHFLLWWYDTFITYGINMANYILNAGGAWQI